MYKFKERIDRFIAETAALLYETAISAENIEIRRGKLSFPCKLSDIKDGFMPYRMGDVWSGENFNDYALFKFTMNIPETPGGYDNVLSITTNKGGHNMVNPQMLIFAGDTALQGLDTNHRSVCVTELSGNSSKICFYIYAFSGLPKKTPYGDGINMDTSDGVRLYVSLCTRRKELWDFYHNIKTPYEYLKYFNENSYEYQKIVTDINEALNLTDFRNPHSAEFYGGIAKANEYLEKTLYSGNSGVGNATLVGHTHIDLAWLWRYEHTMDKVLRSFATEVKLLREYDCHRFMSSQAQLYEYVKTQTPELYEEIKELVAQGKWEAEGAMWVEPDMNLSAGESIILQILYGKKFFRDEFGTDCKILWLPDVFGYTAALPQILKKSGVHYFMTSKLGTNEKNRFPYDTFSWKGIDGSEVLAHCTSYLPGVYNPNIENGDILPGWNEYLQKNINDDILAPFGFADGGGGVTAEQIEAVKRANRGLPGVPKVKIGTAGDYFEKLDKKVSGNKNLPVWTGEIYYEKHRGTYTSMARIKKQNRKCEFLYSNAQWLWLLADCFEKKPFPKNEFDKGMKNMLLNQFHDVLPGTSIREVYEDADVLYKEAFDIGGGICNAAIDTLNPALSDDKITVFNPFCRKVSGYAKHGDKYIYAENVPAKGFGTYSPSLPTPELSVKISGNTIENQYYKLKISESGEIESLYDKKAHRECFRGSANRLRIFEDKSDLMGWGTFCDNEDNWNLESYYSQHEFDMPMPESISVVYESEEYVTVRVERKYMSSVICQDITVYARSPRIDFKTELDWKEHSQVIKAEFPVDVNATRATYEIQFGFLERSTVFNTSWDEAKFEVCAHKWADVSDGGYGMALMNDCKYGYSCNGSVLSLTLLRCGNSPNPDADKEHHSFTYSILPHAGDIRQADVVREAYMLNNPLFTADGCIRENEFSLFECDGAVLDTIKPAEDGDGWVVRLYEPYNCTQKVSLKCGRKITKALPVDIMENPTCNLDFEKTDNTLTFGIKPFEIVTLKVWLDI